MRSLAAAYGTRVIVSSGSSLVTGLCGTGSAAPSSACQCVELACLHAELDRAVPLCEWRLAGSDSTTDMLLSGSSESSFNA